MPTRKLKRRMKGGAYNSTKPRFLYIKTRNHKSGKTGRVIKNINDEHILAEFNYPKTVEIIEKRYLNSLGEPCEKSCATCGCIPYGTSEKDMLCDSIPGHPERPSSIVEYHYNSNNNYYSNRRKKEKYNSNKKQYDTMMKRYIDYASDHSVKQGTYKIEPIDYPLYTSWLATCSALMLDIINDRQNMHFLTHIDGGESELQIAEMISAIMSHCDSRECIRNIRIWAGAGSNKERGMVLNNPNVISMPVIIRVLQGLDLIDIRDEDKIYYRGTDEEIPVVKTCFRHFVGK